MMMAVIFDRPEQGGKGFREATDYDRRGFGEAEKMLEMMLDENPELLPTEPIPTTELRRISLPLYGLDAWSKLFNSRHMISLVAFGQKIQSTFEYLSVNSTQDYATAVSTYLAMAFDRLADQSSTLVAWIPQLEAISHVFTRQALGIVWDYVENNPITSGGGSFQSALGWVINVVEYCSMSSDRPAVVRQGSATRLMDADLTFNAVITDPPYYDAVPYSHLADYFYVWLKRVLGPYASLG